MLVHRAPAFPSGGEMESTGRAPHRDAEMPYVPGRLRGSTHGIRHVLVGGIIPADRGAKFVRHSAARSNLQRHFGFDLEEVSDSKENRWSETSGVVFT
jgi:hypothetical protein